MQYTETELSKLIETVEKEFSGVLNKAEEDRKASAGGTTASVPLAKSEEKKDEKPPEKKDEKPSEHKEDKAPEKKDEAPQAEAKPDAAAEAKPESKPGEEKPAEHQAAPAQGEDQCDYDDEDMEHMHKMYGSMSKAELKAHHDATRIALDKCGDMSMAKSENATSTPAATPAEVKVESTQPNQEVALLKSELEAEKAKGAEIKKNYDAVQEFLTKLAKKTAPAGKAITELAVITKSEGAVGGEQPTLSKSEITQKLMQKASDPKLEKNDREAINNFYASGQTNINTISHLLK